MDGKVAIVTAAGRGIGEAAARELGWGAVPRWRNAEKVFKYR